MKTLSILCLLGMMVSLTWAQNDNSSADKETSQAANIIQQMTSGNAGIPDSVLSGAKCIAVVPHMIKGAFMVGGEHGRGLATCRTGSGWSAPAPFAISGGSIGWQIGGQSSDLVMMVMNQQGMDQLMSGHFKVGAGASVAAGPVGRSGSANAGWKAAILTYARSKGAFAGVSVNGSAITQDKKVTRDLYGHDVAFDNILKGQVPTPPAAQSFVSAVTSAEQSASAHR
ncbi:MAG TPA: lipid-binding SYLF domain-containing protein [Terriglobales bacterium]|nr:lipid-binding SYLF domain-containing protein [Terriglobales bacterium]